MKSDPDVKVRSLFFHARGFGVKKSRKMIAADGTRLAIVVTKLTVEPPKLLSSSVKLARVSVSTLQVSTFAGHRPDHHKVFIAEITARAFIIADSNKRRTLSRSDIAKALSKSDQFDFLIDVVPREDTGGVQASTTPANKGKKKPDGVRFSPLVLRWPAHPLLVQPSSPDDTAGEQLEESDQVTQALSLGHVRTSCSMSAFRGSTFTRYHLIDKSHARFRIRIRRFLTSSRPHTSRIVFCISRTCEL